MKNATIATSRTRAAADHLIDYRPLPAQWGDLEALRTLRAARSRAAARGTDASTMQLEIAPAGSASGRRTPGRQTERVTIRRTLHQLLRALAGGPRREAGAHRRRAPGGGHLATA